MMGPEIQQQVPISPKVLEWRYYPCPGKCRLGSIRREVKDSALELGTWMGLNCKGTIVEYWIYRVRASPAPKLIWCQTLESLRAFKNDSTCLTDPRFRDEKGNIGYKCGILVILAAHKRTWSQVSYRCWGRIIRGTNFPFSIIWLKMIETVIRTALLHEFECSLSLPQIHTYHLHSHK